MKRIPTKFWKISIVINIIAIVAASALGIYSAFSAKPDYEEIDLTIETVSDLNSTSDEVFSTQTTTEKNSTQAKTINTTKHTEPTTKTKSKVQESTSKPTEPTEKKSKSKSTSKNKSSNKTKSQTQQYTQKYTQRTTQKRVYKPTPSKTQTPKTKDRIYEGDFVS